MRRTLLVARREFLENLRTKTFWIGIFSFPVLLTVSIAVPIWLERTKDVREYAVVDESGWLLEAVERRADAPDIEKVFLELKRRVVERSPEVASLPEPIRVFAEGLKDVPDEHLRKAAALVAAAGSPEGGALEELPPELRDSLRETRERIRAWWKALPPEEAMKYAPALTKTRYRRVPADDLGPDPIASLNRRVERGELFAYFVIGKDPLDGNQGCKYVSNNLTDKDLKAWFTALASQEVESRRFEREKIDPEVARRIQAPIDFAERKVGKGGAEEAVRVEDTARQWAPLAFVYLLWISVFVTAQMLLTNTIEEKSNRIIEVLLSSISPFELMAGKIVGIAGTGLTVVGSWTVFFLLSTKLVPVIIGRDLPFDLAGIAGDPLYLASFIAYFLLGYLLYAALLVGLGSVCNSLKEAQNLMQPVALLLIIPLLAMTAIGKDPNGALAKVLSYIPPFTPFVMMNRAAGPPTVAEYVTTTALLLVSIALAFAAAGRIFRIGILMTGKPPRVREILRWIREPGGAVPGRREEG